MRWIETDAHVLEGVEALKQLDERLARVAALAGAVPLRRRTPGFEGLAAIVVSQMVSRASADAIWRRLAERTGTVTPEAVLALSEADCRAIGLSRAKETTLMALAKACAGGEVDLDRLCRLDAEAAIADLVRLKGIGPWTAQVYLLFCGGHPDVFPAGDIALQSAARHAFQLDERPNAVELARIAQRWSPWRGVAARLLWAYYATAMGRDAVPLTGSAKTPENGA